MTRMNTPPSPDRHVPEREVPGGARPWALRGFDDDHAEVRAWLRLKRETAELHAKLEYLKLMLTLGVR
jgi:hypothetical protein